MSGRRHTHNGIYRKSPEPFLDVSHKKIHNDNKKLEKIQKATEEDVRVENFILQQLIFSRCILLVFQCCINWIMWDWPTDAFKGIQAPKTFFDSVINFLLEGLAKWDARHFLHIAEFGYTWESELAFFPLFPMILRLAGSFIHALFPMISFRYAMILAGVIINNATFVVAGLVMFRLVRKITGSLKEAMIAVYVFCWNPASIFFSNLYTESIYSLITFFGMLVLEENRSSRFNQILAASVFSMAFMTRSNGFLNIGYIGFALLLEALFQKSSEKLSHLTLDYTVLSKALKMIPLMLFYVFIMILPLRIFSFVMEEKFCRTTANYLDPVLDDIDEDAVLPGMLDELTWCSAYTNSHRVSLMHLFSPSYYGAVQEKYWNVGFLKYWRLKKLPLFIIASPTLGFTFYGVYNVLNEIIADKRMINQVLTDHRHPIPYAIHSLFIACCGIFFYNVEVSIRILFSSSPFIYLTLARIMARQTPKIKVPEDLLEPFELPFLFNYAYVKPIRFLMLAYLLGYFTIGTLMHVNFLPYV